MCWLSKMPCRITDDPRYDYDNYLEANNVTEVDDIEVFKDHREWLDRQPNIVKRLLELGL